MEFKSESVQQTNHPQPLIENQQKDSFPTSFNEEEMTPSTKENNQRSSVIEVEDLIPVKAEIIKQEAPDSVKIEPKPNQEEENGVWQGPMILPLKKSNRRQKLFEKKSAFPPEYAQTRISDFFNKKNVQNQSKPFLKAAELAQNSQIRKYQGFFKTPVPQDFSPALQKPKRINNSKPFTKPSERKTIKKSVKKPVPQVAKKRVSKMVSKKSDSISKISNNEIRSLAQRGGVKRVGKDVYGEVRAKLQSFLERLVHGAMDLTEQRGRKTVSALDVVQALKIQGAIES